METVNVLPLSHTLLYEIIWQHNFIEPHLEFHSRFVLLKDSSHTVSHTLCLWRSHTHTHAHLNPSLFSSQHAPCFVQLCVQLFSTSVPLATAPASFSCEVAHTCCQRTCARQSGNTGHLSRHKESTHTSPSLLVSELRTVRFQNLLSCTPGQHLTVSYCRQTPC